MEKTMHANHGAALLLLLLAALLVVALLLLGFNVAGAYDAHGETPLKGVFAAIAVVGLGLMAIRCVYRKLCK